MEAALGEMPLAKADRIPFSSADGCGGIVLRRALSAGGRVPLRAASVAGRQRQKRASSELPATAATTAIRAAVLQCTIKARQQQTIPEKLFNLAQREGDS